MGLGLLGTAIAGGFKGAGEIADDELKNRAAASLAAQRDAAAAQREERLNELRKEMANNQLQAQQGQWDVQNKKTDAELQLREQANQNTSEYQKELLKLRAQEVGKQSAQEQEINSRSAWAKELSTTTDPAKLDSLKLYGKWQGWLSDKSDSKDFTETVDPVTGAKSRIYGKQPQKEAPVLGAKGDFDPTETAKTLAKQSGSPAQTNEASDADIAAKQQLRSADPNLAGMTEQEASSAQLKQRAQGLLSKFGNAIIGRVSTPEDAAALVDDLGKQIQSMPKDAPERYGIQARYERAISDPLYQQWLKQQTSSQK